MKMKNGFTLIEIMITIAVVAILVAIAVPSYVDYIRRGKIAEATSNLADMRVKMEQYFQDNRTYLGGVPGVNAPCTAGSGVPIPAGTRYFAFTCTLTSATQYTITATGIATQGMDGFVYTVNELNAQASTISGAAATAGYVTNATCWIVRRGTGAKAC